MIRPRQFGSAFIRHVEAYGQLAAAAGRDLGDIGRRRAILATGGLVLSSALVTLAGATLIAAGWNTAWRWWVAGAVLVALALATYGCLSAAFAALPRSRHMQALHDEWQKDKAWLSSRNASGSAREPSAAVVPGVTRQQVIRSPAATLHDA